MSASLIDRGILGHPRHELVDTALAAQDVGPQLLRHIREGIVGLCGLDDPVVARELVLELARTPAGIAGEDAPPRRYGNDLLRIVERRKAQCPEQRYRRF